MFVADSMDLKKANIFIKLTENNTLLGTKVHNKKTLTVIQEKNATDFPLGKKRFHFNNPKKT